ncbi:peptidase M48, Ste24p [Pseudomonas sp. NUPR-001]|uniref:peptidase M48, Ste24p n=1 Tax=Pseudomonas sp. NUPR-001 TaxID=3416058 RepID=UPI003F9C33AE
MEPTTTAAGALLAKYSVALAAFIGAILSLGFLKGLTRGQAATAVLTGFFFSTYLTQPVSAYLAKSLELEMNDYLLCGVAFLLGLTAMNIIPGIKAALGQFIASRGPTA